ncbi:MAG: hypothetical protein N2D54_02120, partial [Chloroflexota bacterium]
VYFTPMGGDLFFRAENGNGTDNVELWRTDGIFGGDSSILEIYGGTPGAYPTELTALNGKLYFKATHSGSDFELWQSDGNNINRVKDINPGPDSSGVSQIVALNNGILFAANNGTDGSELWYYNPTAIFFDGFELGNKAAWTDVVIGGAEIDSEAICKLCVTKKGAIHGKYSLKVNIQDRKVRFIKDAQPSGENKYHASFRIKLGSTLKMDNLNQFKVLKALSGSKVPFSLDIRRKGTTFQIRGNVRKNNGDDFVTTWVFLPKGVTSVEVEWYSSGGGGIFKLFINGKLKRFKGGLHTDTFAVTAVQLGVTSKIKAAHNISGSFKLDSFHSDKNVIPEN